MKVLFIADIVGSSGRQMFAENIGRLKNDYHPDFTIVNAENAAGGKGITREITRELFTCGVDVITSGNHAFDRKESADAFGDERVLRPANYPSGVLGKGHGVYEVNGQKLAVINLMGRIYMPLTDDPFTKADALLNEFSGQTKNILVDFHAEVTSEKVAMGLYLDGRVSAVLGTHTHIQTADAKILPNGTAYITDAGMTGPAGGVIGMDKNAVFKKFLTGLPQHFVISETPAFMQGCLIEIDNKSGHAISIKSITLQS